MTDVGSTDITRGVRIRPDATAPALEPVSQDERRPGFVRRLLVGAITGYQRLISPWLGPRCRFTPSCSEYAQEAILLRGPVIGLALAAFRLLRCQPLCAGGYDPVPPPRAARDAARRSVRDVDPTEASDASAQGAPAC
jgi:putative membrane protein insertion efficiency factor